MPLFINNPERRGEGIRVNITEQKIREIFEEADRDGDGILKKEDVQFAFHQLGAKFPAWRAHRGLHHADMDHDGVVNTREELNNLIKYTLQKYGYIVGN